MKFTSDVDIDFADRDLILKLIKHVPAVIVNQDKTVKHNTGVYVTEIPTDPRTGHSAIDYRQAESRGYVKLDFLNVSVYGLVSSQEHLSQLIQQQPPWHKLYDQSFCEQLIHIGNHYNTLLRMPEPVDSIPRLAMFLALIRPGKKHLIGQDWKSVAAKVWVKPDDDSYYFKKSHSVAYAQLVAVHMNLLNLANQGN